MTKAELIAALQAADFDDHADVYVWVEGGQVGVPIDGIDYDPELGEPDFLCLKPRRALQTPEPGQRWLNEDEAA